jgi:hypothetical protein
MQYLCVHGDGHPLDRLGGFVLAVGLVCPWHRAEMVMTATQPWRQRGAARVAEGSRSGQSCKERGHAAGSPGARVQAARPYHPVPG